MPATLLNLISGPGLFLLLGLILFFFGGKKLPALVQGFREAIGAFREGQRGKREKSTRRKGEDEHQ